MNTMNILPLSYMSPLLLALILTGCSALIKTPYEPPAITLPVTWEYQTGVAAAKQNHWWQGFGDPVLNTLIEEALRRNNNLAVAALTLRKAQLQAELTGSERIPSFKVQGEADISHNLGSGYREIRNFATAASVSYEVDLWGKLSSSYDAASWEAQATEEDRASIALSLAGTTASLYWRIAYLNQRIMISKESIAYARKTLELVQVQKAAGAVTNLEVMEAERNLASQEASQTILIQQRVEARNALAILFDGPPQSLKTSEPENLAQARLPPLDAGIPAELLAQRPDLRAAEARLRSALANADATRASFYPAINLNGSLGGSSDQLSRMLSNPMSFLGANLALPFVQWRDMQRNIKISEAQYQQAVLTFRQTLYNALADVENSLSAQQQNTIQAKKLELTLFAARQTEELYRLRYQTGGSPLKFWLDAQENRRQAEVALAANRFEQLQNYINLSKALGGDRGNTLDKGKK